MASPAEGAVEDAHERTPRCVSARPEAATHGWAARCGAVVDDTVVRWVSERADPTTRERPAVGDAVVTGKVI
jgi:hypothetical protein